MKEQRFIWNVAKTTLLIVATIVGGLAIGFAAYRITDLASEPKNRTVRQLVRGLQKQDSRSDLAWQALWPKLPNFFTSRFPGLEPATAVSVRRDSGSELIQRGTAAGEAMPALIAALRDTDLQVRTLAIQALARLGPSAKPALDELLKFFEDEKHDLAAAGVDSSRGQAALALSAIAPEEPRVAELLCGALHKRWTNGLPSQVRYHVLRALENVATETNAVISNLIRALKEADRDLVLQLAATMEPVQSISADKPKPSYPTMDPQLLERFGLLQKADATANFVAQVLISLGRIGPKTDEVVPMLVGKLSSRDARIRSAAVIALANAGSGSSQTVPALIRVYVEARAENSATSQAEKFAAFSGRSPTLPRLWPATRGNYFTNLAEQVLWAIGRLGPSAQAAIPFLTEELKNKANPYRADVALVYWQIDRKAQPILPVFAEELKGDDPAVRRKVARALRWLGVEAVPTIIGALDDEDRQVRFAAVESLQTMGPIATEAVPMLEQIFKTDPRNSLRMAAANALRKIRPDMAEKWKPELLPSDFRRGAN
jgi:HEAT repeat protein